MWNVVEIEGRMHVIPRDDLRPHDDSAECWCRPFDEDGVCVHNSLDRREHVERGDALKH